MSLVNHPISDLLVFRDDDNAALTGLTSGDLDTLEAYLIDTPATTAAVTLAEIGGGEYRATFTPTAAGAWALHAVYGSGSLFDFIEITRRYEVTVSTGDDPLANPISNYSDPTTIGGVIAQLTSVGTVALTTAPVAVDGAITLYRRNDYDADESRALDWSTTDAATWPILTGAAIAFASKPVDGPLAKGVIATGAVVTATGANKAVRVELAASATANALAGRHNYQLRATLADGHVVTLASGVLVLVDYIGS